MKHLPINYVANNNHQILRYSQTCLAYQGSSVQTTE